MNQDYQQRILLARSRSPFKPATTDEIKVHKKLTPIAKKFLLELQSRNRTVVFLNKRRHRNLVEVFESFDVNESITSEQKYQYTMNEWFNKEQHIINKTVYVQLYKKTKSNGKYDLFQDASLGHFIDLIKSKKYSWLFNKCVNEKLEINHNLLYHAIKHLEFKGEFYHPTFIIDYSGQTYDFLWYPAFKSCLTKTFKFDY